MSASRRFWVCAAVAASVLVCPVACGAPLVMTAAAAARGTSDSSTQRAYSSGQPLSLSFPRIGMWRPDPSKQPLADIAQYGLVILAHSSGQYVPQLRALNPHLIVLGSASAATVGYDPSQAATSSTNALLTDIPAQWLLTQVGANLTQDVDAANTTLNVSRLEAEAGGRTYQLFVPGDTVVLDDELADVTAVDAATNTLTVIRGCVKPAGPHRAGTRVAAVVRTGPDWIEADLSTYCPRIAVDPANGPETWAEYNARITAELFADSSWDGVGIDGAWAHPSLVVSSSAPRTIDPDRSNTVQPEAVFDTAWEDGIRQYESRLRALLGDGKIILSNCSDPNYDLLNGTNFEGFPDPLLKYGTSWSQAVCGPSNWGYGSYYDWLANARQPNVTMISTVYDSAASGENDTCPYDNPSTHPDLVSSYREMRFGLCSALMGDGFFSYEVSSRVLGKFGLPWFDEFDGAGKGAGYLGQPLGPARLATSALTTPNLVPGGDFDSQDALGQWRLYVQGANGYSATVERDTASSASGASSARIDVAQAGGANWGVVLAGRSLRVIKGDTYTLSFSAKADSPRLIDSWVDNPAISGHGLLDFSNTALTASWQRFVVSVTAARSGTGPLMFGLGQCTGSVWLDDVRLQLGRRDVWRRDFDNGVALVNPSSSAAAVPLGGVWQKIKGTQDPSVNDGSLTAEVTLPASDGLVLIRPAGSSQDVANKALAQLTSEWRRSVLLSKSAKSYYSRLARLTTGDRRAQAVRARGAWRKALEASRVMRNRATGCRTTLAAGDVTGALAVTNAMRNLAARIEATVTGACRLGHRPGSCAEAARRSVAAGCNTLLTVRVALAASQ